MSPGRHRAQKSQNVIQFTLRQQEQLDLVETFAQENLKAAQQTQEQHYKNAQLQVYQPGDQVLLLLPSLESKFFAKWDHEAN